MRRELDFGRVAVAQVPLDAVGEAAARAREVGVAAAREREAKRIRARADAGIGAGPDAFSFSFSRGRNAHFPDTGRRFADGVQRYLRDGHATKIKFPPHGNLVILGRLDD